MIFHPFSATPKNSFLLCKPQTLFFQLSWCPVAKGIHKIISTKNVSPIDRLWTSCSFMAAKHVPVNLLIFLQSFPQRCVNLFERLLQGNPRILNQLRVARQQFGQLVHDVIATRRRRGLPQERQRDIQRSHDMFDQCTVHGSTHVNVNREQRGRPVT